jgi:hypothetical protein
MQTKTICTKVLRNAAAAFTQLMTSRRLLASGQAPARPQISLDHLFTRSLGAPYKRSKHMPNYRVRIRWTQWGHVNGVPVDTRITRAMEAADRHGVVGRNNVPLDRNVHRHDEGDNDHVTWHVHGTQNQVSAMLNRWSGNSDGPNFPAFQPNIEVLEWPVEP